MTERTRGLIETWFSGLNSGDTDTLLALFADAVTIRNAANPLLTGPDAARTLLAKFFRRTAERSFTLIDAAAEDNQVFATWTATLTFDAGALIAGVTLRAPLTVPLRGIDRFGLDTLGRIRELDIVHETSSIPAAARAMAAEVSNA